MSLSPCSVPGCLPSFDLPPGDMELGLGETKEEQYFFLKKVVVRAIFCVCVCVLSLVNTVGGAYRTWFI